MRHGFLLIDKAKGPTSHDVVGSVRRRLSEKNIGHLGTLDPQATGLMVLAVGAKGLKVVELFAGLPKEYEAQITFGAVSTTYDAEGTLTPVPDRAGWQPPEHAAIQRLINDSFVGSIDQIPPAHSAVHIGGERAYRKARQGKNVVLPSRKVVVTAFDVQHYAFPLLQARVACSAGTYIRSLANDLGALLRCGGYLSALRRTSVGPWSVDRAVTVEQCSWTDVLPLKDVLQGLPKVQITAEQDRTMRFGQDLSLELHCDTIAWHEGLPVAILSPLKDGSRQAHPRKVF